MSARFGGLLAAMAALLAAGLATGTRVYYALCILLLLMIAYALASILWLLLSVRVSVKGVRPRMLRGEKLMTILTVEHRSPLPGGSLRLRLNVPGGMGGRQEIRVSVPPFVKHNFRNVIRCPHRGSYEVGVTQIAASDPFGLFEISRKSNAKLARVEVRPRPMKLAAMKLQAADVGPEFRSSATEDAASPSDVRSWRDGDELKKVHWKLSLRKRELMVRTFEESARPDTLIIPDLGEVTALHDQRLTLEDAICEAALGAAKAQLEAGFPVRLTLQNTRPQELAGRGPSDLPGFSDALMRARFDCPHPYEQVLMLVFQRMQRTGGAVLATGRLTTRTVDIAIRMQQRGVRVKLIWATDAPREEALEMLERLKMAGASVECVDPWAEENPAPQRPASDEGVDDVFEI